MQPRASSSASRRLAGIGVVIGGVVTVAGLLGAIFWLAAALAADSVDGRDILIALAWVTAGGVCGWICFVLSCLLRTGALAHDAPPEARPSSAAPAPDAVPSLPPPQDPAAASRDDGRSALAVATQRAEAFMSVAAFDKARGIAQDLLDRNDSAEARQLVERIHREARTFAFEQRRRLYQQADRLAAERRWREASAAARKLLEDYPNSPEADAVAGRMDTLEANARLAEARELRDRLRDMLQRRRYTEAAALAEDVLSRFPDTQIAAELRGQLDRLRELAGLNRTP
ncbi:MAG: hypothetical protein KGY99_05910 [Phycisphaerae bacterium]|nr:hypothetical protein [Phycisphaerae bacterium]